jgi:hypothetical protein
VDTLLVLRPAAAFALWATSTGRTTIFHSLGWDHAAPHGAAGPSAANVGTTPRADDGSASDESYDTCWYTRSQTQYVTRYAPLGNIADAGIF